MELGDLKKRWQQEHASKSEHQIGQMIKRRSSSVYARTKRKAVMESVAFVLVFLVFMTGLDAHLNEWWVNLFFAVVIGVGIANNLMLYRSMTLNAKGEDVKTSLQKATVRLWWQVQFSVVFSVLFFGGVLTFLLLRVAMTEQKMMIAFLLLAFGVSVRTFFEVRKWKKGITALNRCLMELTALGTP